MLSDISSVILTTDLSKILLNGSLILGGFVGVSYGSVLLLNRRKSKEKNEVESDLNEPMFHDNEKEVNDDMVSSLDQETKYSFNLDELATEVSSQDLLESAILFDSYGSKKEAGEILLEAINKETNQKEITRLKFILKRYETGTEDLKFLTTKFPSFLRNKTKTNDEPIIDNSLSEMPIREDKADVVKIVEVKEEKVTEKFQNEEDIIKHIDQFQQFQQGSNQENQFNQFQDGVVEKSQVESVEKFDLAKEVERSFNEEQVNQQISQQERSFDSNFSSIGQELLNLNQLDNDQELVFKDLIEKSAKEESAISKEDQNASEKIFSEFGQLAQQIHSETPNAKMLKKEEVFKVWVNYMSMKSGRMNLQNKFLTLNNPWGSEEAISEVQKTIEAESGKDEKGNKNAWAIISIIPVKP